METIKQLWLGNIDPVAYMGIDVKGIRELERLKERNRQRLNEMLDSEGRALLEKLNDCIDEYISAICEQAFCEGFCLGTKISTEALSGAKEMLGRHNYL